MRLRGCFALLALTAACESSPQTALRVRLSVAAGAPDPTKLLLDVYDARHALLHDTEVPPGGGKPAMPGDVVVLTRDDAGALRVVAQGWNGAILETRGVGRAVVAAHAVTVVDVVLSSPPGSDRDGDLVPDD